MAATKEEDKVNFEGKAEGGEEEDEGDEEEEEEEEGEGEDDEEEVPARILPETTLDVRFGRSKNDLRVSNNPFVYLDSTERDKEEEEEETEQKASKVRIYRRAQQQTLLHATLVCGIGRPSFVIDNAACCSRHDHHVVIIAVVTAAL